MIDFEHHEMLRNLAGAVEQIAKDHMRPFTREVDEHEHSNPEQYVKTMYEVLKMTGGAMNSPVMGAKEGGEKKRRTGNVTSVVFIEKLAWGDCGMYLATPMPLLGGAAVGAAGTPEQKQRFLKRFQEGEPKWAAMAITEPGSGSDSGSIQTTAELDGDHWVINGEKIFVTAGKRAVEESEGFVVVWATVDRKAGRAGIKPFLVDHHTPGMKVVKLEKKHGIRCSDTAAIVFENCRIPKENLLGSAEVKASADATGFKGVMATFDATRPPVAASAVGVGRASLEYTQEYLDKQGVQPRYGIARNKLTAVERDLMLMEAKVKASWLLTLKAAWMSDMGEPNNLEASICKCKAGRDMVWVCQKAVELLGPEGYSRQHLVEKWMRDSKIGDIYEGTQNIQKLVVARRIFGYSRDQLA
ncbi:MAG TPA: acyl-CoA dehydrogenase family protein [Polyangiales bacterium]|nr:acyl-CoA dehydrogenase family protein [Polyangiales bacterium]